MTAPTKFLAALVSLLEDISLNRNVQVYDNPTIGHCQGSVHSHKDMKIVIDKSLTCIRIDLLGE